VRLWCAAAIRTTASFAPAAAGLPMSWTHSIAATRLEIEAGSTRAGFTFAVGGVPDLSLGKSADRHVVLIGPAVARSHAKLVRLDFGPSKWKVVDDSSRNGLFVNDCQVSKADLSDGDLVRIIWHPIADRIPKVIAVACLCSGRHRPALPPIAYILAAKSAMCAGTG
jgi:hypothetical protein